MYHSAIPAHQYCAGGKRKDPIISGLPRQCRQLQDGLHSGKNEKNEKYSGRSDP
jgi:hypothetical protein